ncbi:class I SAM-dependent methyltransferase [Candidatus Woesearchaeota archaeon]|nr:class I SAM-dependent methyltransferase [Candidatus Woesearchaeota archaeon]
MDYLYKRFAEYYDLCYSKKDYNKETNFLKSLIKKYKITGKHLLEFGCGTGGHAIHLRKDDFKIVGVDLNKEMLKIARKKSKSIHFLQGDMRTCDLKKRFDIVICLFSTIHYNQNCRELEKTLRNFYKHLKPRGLLIFDMGFNEERWSGGHIFVDNWSNREVDLVRFSKSRRNEDYGILDMACIIFKNNKFQFEEEHHKLRIFKTPEVKKLVEKIGFNVDLYAGYTKKVWQKNSKKYVVFAGVKQ